MASASQRAAVLLFAVVLVACGVGSLALYEDQVGEHDWLKQHVGALSTVVSVGKRAFVGTQSAVVACLNVRTGSTVWRQVLPVGDVVEQMLLRKRRLVTVSSCGRNVRLWYAPTGELVWDTVLPVEVDGTSCTPASATLIDGADGTTLAAVATQSHVFVINVADGRVVWSWATGAACASTAVAAGAAPGAVTVACGDRLLAFDSVSVEGDAEDVDNPPVGDETAESGSVVFVSPTHGLVVATSSEAGVVVRAHRTSSVATVTTGQLGGAVESLSVAVHMDGAVLVELEDGTEVVVAVQESATAEAAVSADGSSVDAASDTSFGAFVVVLGTHKMTDPSVGTAVKGDVTYVATVDIGATGAVFSVSADASSTQTAQVSGITSDEFGTATGVFLLPYDSSSGAVGHRAVVVTSTDAVFAVQLTRNEALWVRQEALASPTGVAIVDSGDYSEAHLKRMDSDEEDEVLDLSFGARIALQVEDLKAIAQSLLELAKDPVAGLADSGSLADYRANKTIVVLTRAGVLFGIDSISGDTRWSRVVATPGHSTRLLMTRSRLMATHAPEVLLLTRTDSRTLSYTYVNAESGAPCDRVGTVRVAPGDLRLATRVQEHDATHRQLVVVVDSEGALTVLPQTHGARAKFGHSVSSFVFALVDREAGTVAGYTVAPGADVQADSLDTVLVWSIALPAGDVVVDAAQVALDDAVHTPARVLGDNSLLLKYLNPNLLVVASTNDGRSESSDSKPVKSVTIHVIDAVSGRTLDTRTHRAATGPVNVIMHENWVQYTYWNHKTKVQEIASMVLYEGTMGSRDLNPLHMPEDAAATEFSSYHAVDPMVSAQTWVLPAPVTTMAVTRTAASISHRWLLMGLESGALWCLDRRMVDPRRPLQEKDKASRQREGMMPYQAHLPLQHMAFASYNLTVDRIEYIVSAPTALESTSIVAAVGLDVFATRVHPSKEFDSLSSDFNKPLLVLLSCGLLVATLLLRAAAKRKAVRAAWK